MQTYSHTVITAALERTLQEKQTESGSLYLAGIKLPPLKTGAFLVGSFLPDLLLTLIAIGAIGYDRLSDGSKPSRTRWLFGHAFFNVWWVKAAHNLFHAPLLLFSYLIIGYIPWIRGRDWGASLFWLSTASLLHTAIDIPLHYDDGPLLLFPFEWETRFRSPVSYWDPKRYGRIFAPLEHIFVLIVLIYLLIKWRRNAKGPTKNSRNKETE